MTARRGRARRRRQHVRRWLARRRTPVASSGQAVLTGQPAQWVPQRHCDFCDEWLPLELFTRSRSICDGCNRGPTTFAPKPKKDTPPKPKPKPPPAPCRQFACGHERSATNIKARYYTRKDGSRQRRESCRTCINASYRERDARKPGDSIDQTPWALIVWAGPDLDAKRWYFSSKAAAVAAAPADRGWTVVHIDRATAPPAIGLHEDEIEMAQESRRRMRQRVVQKILDLNREGVEPRALAVQVRMTEAAVKDVIRRHRHAAATTTSRPTV